MVQLRHDYLDGLRLNRGGNYIGLRRHCGCGREQGVIEVRGGKDRAKAEQCGDAQDQG
jgi:hypothetical protein